jgi:hypothetical protein
MSLVDCFLAGVILVFLVSSLVWHHMRWKKCSTSALNAERNFYQKKLKDSFFALNEQFSMERKCPKCGSKEFMICKK